MTKGKGTTVNIDSFGQQRRQMDCRVRVPLRKRRSRDHYQSGRNLWNWIVIEIIKILPLTAQPSFSLMRALRRLSQEVGHDEEVGSNSRCVICGSNRYFAGSSILIVLNYCVKRRCHQVMNSWARQGPALFDSSVSL
jgi:hypothetical protein